MKTNSRIIIGLVILLCIIIGVPAIMVKSMSVSKDAFEINNLEMQEDLANLKQAVDDINKAKIQLSSSLDSTITNIDELKTNIATMKSVVDTMIGSVDTITKGQSNFVSKSEMTTQINNATGILQAQELNDFNSLAKDMNDLKQLALRNELLFNSVSANITDLQKRVKVLETSPYYPSPDYGVQRLIGSADTDPSTYVGGNHFVLCRFQCYQTGVVTNIRMRCIAFGSVMVAIYSENGTSPTTLLTQSVGGTSVNSGLNSVEINEYELVAGNWYWLAFNSSGNLMGANKTGGEIRYRPANYAGFAFPSEAGTGFTIELIYNTLISGCGD